MATLFTTVDLQEEALTCVPHHIAIIMDGNRRWAQRHSQPAEIGHFRGAEVMTQIIRAAAKLGVKVMTVYAFSTENWNRTRMEIASLMEIFHLYLHKMRLTMIEEGVRLATIGNLEPFPDKVKEALRMVKEDTSQGTQIDLVLALNYGGRDDLRRAALRVAEDFANGKLQKDAFTEEVFAQYLDTACWPDPDLLIRTSGELRVSNFLLWQISYSEVYITDVLWPDFSEEHLLSAIREFQRRKRRHGGG